MTPPIPNAAPTWVGDTPISRTKSTTLTVRKDPVPIESTVVMRA